MKRLFCILLSVMLVFGLIGCTKAEKPEPSPETSVSASVEEQTPASTEVSVPEPEKEPEDPLAGYSLKEVFEAKGLKVGTCINTTMTGNADYNNLVLSQFNSVTMENSMKPDYIFDKTQSIASGETELVVKFSADAIKLFDWAKKNGVSMRGHTIVWYSQTPDWIFYNSYDKSKGYAPRDVMLARLESAIKNVFAELESLGYSDMFYAYDIVNEYWMEDGTMRQNNWTATIGDDYVWYALYYARQYAPENIDLYINDYNEQFKHNSVIKFMKTLVDDDGNYLMDGIGLQAHLYTEDSLTTYFEAVDTYASLGLKVELTELDVELGAWQKKLLPTDDNYKIQGQYFYDLIKGLLDRIDAGTLKMDAITFWGFTDKLSWRSDQYPCLFTKQLKPKYAFFGAAQDKVRAGYSE